MRFQSFRALVCQVTLIFAVTRVGLGAPIFTNRGNDLDHSSLKARTPALILRSPVNSDDSSDDNSEAESEDIMLGPSNHEQSWQCEICSSWVKAQEREGHRTTFECSDASFIAGAVNPPPGALSAGVSTSQNEPPTSQPADQQVEGGEEPQGTEYEDVFKGLYPGPLKPCGYAKCTEPAGKSDQWKLHMTSHGFGYRCGNYEICKTKTLKIYPYHVEKHQGYRRVNPTENKCHKTGFYSFKAWEQVGGLAKWTMPGS